MEHSSKYQIESRLGNDSFSPVGKPEDSLENAIALAKSTQFLYRERDYRVVQIMVVTIQTTLWKS